MDVGCGQKKPLAKDRKWLRIGGAGNRTRVPWHFGIGFYMCSLFRLETDLAAVPRSLPPTPTSRVRRSLSVSCLAPIASESDRIAPVL